MTLDTITFKLASEGDDLRVMNAFKSMLIESHELGHDILPSDYNVSFFWEHIFEPEIHNGTHGIVLAIEGHECVGALFITPERSRIQTDKVRAIAHGVWVNPSHRRMGIAYDMQLEGHRRMRELGYAQVISSVVSQNSAGLASCRKAGAKVTGVLTTVYL